MPCLLLTSPRVSGRSAGVTDSSLKNFDSRNFNSSRKLADGRTEEDLDVLLLDFLGSSRSLEDGEVEGFDVLHLEDLEL